MLRPEKSKMVSKMDENVHPGSNLYISCGSVFKAQLKVGRSTKYYSECYIPK